MNKSMAMSYELGKTHFPLSVLQRKSKEAFEGKGKKIIPDERQVWKHEGNIDDQFGP